jgi:hypothetical protein
MATREELLAALQETMQDIEELQHDDPELIATSIRNCALMIRYWSQSLLLAQTAVSGTDKERAVASHSIETASRHLCEWEKRKLAAWEKRKLDELPRLAAKIEEFRRAGSLLEQLQ